MQGIGWETASETTSIHTDLTSRGQLSPPDLTPLDYFIRGYVKESVYKAKPDTNNALKQVIREIISSIGINVLEPVIANFQKRVNRYIGQQGGPWENLYRIPFYISFHVVFVSPVYVSYFF